eukprot:11587598-Karenia_brevis.AAC.1
MATITKIVEVAEVVQVVQSAVQTAEALEFPGALEIAGRTRCCQTLERCQFSHRTLPVNSAMSQKPRWM